MLNWKDSPDVLAGIFEDRRGAQQALTELRAAGFDEKQLGVLSPDRKAPLHDRTIDVADGAAVGAGLGAAAGAWAVTMMSAALPVVGPVVAGGTLASILTAAAGGGVAGALLGGLTGLGMQHNAAMHYSRELNAGKTLVLVRTEGRYPEAAEILERHGADTKSQGIEDTGNVPPEHVRGPSP